MALATSDLELVKDAKSDFELAKEIRENVMTAKSVDKHNRDMYRDNQKFLNLDQWEPREAEKRRNKRLMLTADLLNAPVDQVVNSVRENKPGPEVSPSGEGTDKDDAQIMGGILRRIDYENRSWIAFETALEAATGGNFGCFEMDVEYKNERSFERNIVVKSIADANEKVYFDPKAVEKDRSDAKWAAVLYNWSKKQYKREFPKTKINQAGPIRSLIDYFGSYGDQSMAGWVTDDSVLICKYWRVEETKTMLRLYSDNVARLDLDKYKGNAIALTTPKPRETTLREIKWYLTDGVDILKRGDWEGYWIPLFPVYGRERWVNGKRFITAIIQGAKQAQQAFNYAFTGACEVLAYSTKSPWLGLVGQFRSAMAKWKASNVEPYTFIEYDSVDLPNGQTYTNPPVRNTAEPPVQAFLAFAQICINAVQRATSIFDPSLGKQKSDQSGKAIQELQQQSTEGNFHWSDNLTITLTHYYRALADIVQKEYDSEQVTQIMRADGTPLQVRINADFVSGKDIQGNDIKRKYNIAKGNFAFTVAIGPSTDSQLLANEQKITALIKVLPPELIAQAADLFIKLQNYGPLGDQLAERLTPPQYRDQNDPNAAAAHLAQAMQQNQQLQQVVQKLQMAIATKQPELQVRKYIAELNAVAGIEEAKVKAGDNQQDRVQSMLETVLGMAHEAGSDAADRMHDLQSQHMQQQHEQQQDQQQQDADSVNQDKAHLGAMQQQQQAADNAPEPAE